MQILQFTGSRGLGKNLRKIDLPPLGRLAMTMLMRFWGVVRGFAAQHSPPILSPVNRHCEGV